MNKNKLFYALSAVLVLGGLVASSSVALADRKGGGNEDDNKEKGMMVGLMRGMDMRMDDHKKEAKLDDSTLEVNIKDNGQVLVRGAKVTAVTGNMISATTAWGAMNLNWNVNVLSSTNIVRKFGSVSPLAEIKVGDMISFTGTVAYGVVNDTTMTVNATVLRNESI